MEKLDQRQLVPLTSDEITALRAAAKGTDLSNGLFARTLIAWALSQLRDPSLGAAIMAAEEAAAERTTAAARTAIEARWADNK